MAIVMSMSQKQRQVDCTSIRGRSTSGPSQPYYKTAVSGFKLQDKEISSTIVLSNKQFNFIPHRKVYLQLTQIKLRKRYKLQAIPFLLYN